MDAEAEGGAEGVPLTVCISVHESDIKEAVRECSSSPRRAYYYEGGGTKKDGVHSAVLT